MLCQIYILVVHLLYFYKRGQNVIFKDANRHSNSVNYLLYNVFYQNNTSLIMYSQ